MTLYDKAVQDAEVSEESEKIAEENLFPKEPEENDLLDFSSGM